MRKKNDFIVPDTIKHLSTEQLDAADQTFRHWHESASNLSESRARGRLRLVFLLIRYGALRLGEALALDDEADFDFTASLVRVRSRNARDLQLPEAVLREIRRILDSPAMQGLRGQAFKLDQGYVRRRFYEQAEACGLRRDLLSPRVLRDSRGIELLRGDVPLHVVRDFLGRKDAARAAAYLAVPKEEARRIVSRHLRREAAGRTSARNLFSGTVREVRRGGLLAEVSLCTAEGLEVVAMITADSASNLEVRPGLPLLATIKAPWIIVSPRQTEEHTADAPRSSAANVFAGVVSGVRRADVEAEVLVDLEAGAAVCALITTRSAEELGLCPGMPVWAEFNAFAVILNID